jgi:hypothetical protein
VRTRKSPEICATIRIALLGVRFAFRSAACPPAGLRQTPTYAAIPTIFAVDQHCGTGGWKRTQAEYRPKGQVGKLRHPRGLVQIRAGFLEFFRRGRPIYFSEVVGSNPRFYRAPLGELLGKGASFACRHEHKSRPSASAFSIIARAGRSLIEPEGLALSSFRNSRQGPQFDRVASIGGVLPMRSRTVAKSEYTHIRLRLRGCRRDKHK